MRNSLYSLGGFRAALAAGRMLPRPLAHAVAAGVGRFAAPSSSPAYRAIRENLEIATGLTGAELHRLCAKNRDEFAKSLADYFLILTRSGNYADSLLDAWSGWEQLEAARAAGRGTILVTGHLGHWELGGVLLARRGIAMTVITLEEPSTELTRWRDDYRRRLGITTIAVGPGREFAFVEMIEVLRRNECLAMLVDRPYAGTGLPVTFFGRASEFSSAPALLWQHTGAAVVPAFVVRGATGKYTSFAEPPIPFAAGPDKRAALALNTQQVASVFQSIIRRYPEQWFNYAPIFPPASPA